MIRVVRWLILIIVTCAVLALTVVLLVAASETISPLHSTSQPPPVVAALEPVLAKALAAAGPDERFDVVVEMRAQLDPETLVAGRTMLADAREHLVGALQVTAERTQADVRAYLATQQLTGDVTSVNPFWIFNGLAVDGARPDVVRELAVRPDVALIRLDHWRRWVDPAPEMASDNRYHASQATDTEWGIQRIRADEVWSSLGVDGSGVIVANIDTGVDWQHPSLQVGYRGYDPKGFHQHQGNWFDATDDGAVYPVDGHGHGTHTMGTMIGNDGIGVAPGARWIAVRGFNSDGLAHDSWLHGAFEWLLAPAGDPDLAPGVINNSWGNDVGALAVFQRDIETLRAAGVFLIFSAGNAGPDSGTVGSPASLPSAFAVGASDQDDEVADFSSRGPSPWGEVRPHVVAPGVKISSAEPGGTYGALQGTSMAAPHVAGTVALMLSARPDLSITQTAHVLTSTAIPLTETIPNNDSGFGRVDAYAAVALAADAGLINGTVYGGGVPLPGAMVQATPVLSGLIGTTRTDNQGQFRLFLGAGYYDLTVSAFGYASESVHALSVTTGVVRVQDFDLLPLPTGRLQGTVKAAGGESIEAMVSVVGTAVSTFAEGGSYQLDLPSGIYTLQARALGYRVVTATVPVTAGQDSSYHFVLSDSMRILLVDDGPWHYGSQVAYYRQALDDLSYAYDERPLKHLPADTPTVTDLLAYDLVVWSAPDYSPGYIGASVVVSDYLAGGGNLWLSGQDVGYRDGGGEFAVYPYYINLLHSIFRADNAPSRTIVCRDDNFSGGMTLTVEGGDGADNQIWPDEIAVVHPDNASLACAYDGGRGAVVQAGFCNAHRALNLGFGFEAINAAADRAEFLGRALDWFASPRQVAGVELLRRSDPIQIAPPGGLVTHTFRLRNLGEAGAGDLIRVEVTDTEWPVTVLTPTVDLEACATTEVGLRVEIPTDVTWNATKVLSVTARSSVSPALHHTLVITSKAPAPVLLVDDDRTYDQSPAYEAALRAASLPYDRWEVKGIFGAGSPPAEILAWYPIVVWFNGYDWFDPIHPSETGRLVSYLDQGGRFFLSSQDALDYVGESELVVDRFGVITYSWELPQTAVYGVPGHVLGDGLGPVELAYLVRNWSDSILPAPGSQVSFRGQHGQPAAVTREGPCASGLQTCRWRTAFFAFPIETLPEGERAVLMSRLVGWLSWLGRSTLLVGPAVASVGDTVGYTLTLRNDGVSTVFGATVSNTLPADTTLVDGPDGGAGYDILNRRVTWAGDLPPGAIVTITYRLNLAGGVGDGLVENVADILLGEQGLHFQRQASVRIAAPDLAISSLIMDPVIAESSAGVAVTLVVRNDGVTDASGASVDNPLPWPLRLVTGTLFSSGGGTAIELPGENRIQWMGELPVGEPVTLTYRGVAPPLLREELWLYNAALLQDGQGGAWERGDWLNTRPWRFYFPVFLKNG